MNLQDNTECHIEIIEAGVYFAKVTSVGRISTSRIVLLSN